MRGYLDYVRFSGKYRSRYVPAGADGLEVSVKLSSPGGGRGGSIYRVFYALRMGETRPLLFEKMHSDWQNV